jgi:hypothetical protein
MHGADRAAEFGCEGVRDASAVAAGSEAPEPDSGE